MQRGDLVVVVPIADGKNCKPGDIVLFSVKEGTMKSLGWISHRIVGGDAVSGFMTKGDANDSTDQASGYASNIKPEWIRGKIICIGNGVLKVPLAGYLSIWMEGINKSPYMLPIIAIILAGVIGLSELYGKKKKTNRKISYPAIYFLSGMVISVILCASMITSGQSIKFDYTVDPDNGTATSNDNTFILNERRTIPLANLSNSSFFPTVATITSEDKQLSFSQDLMILNNNAPVKSTVTISAGSLGNHKSMVHIGIFYPFLPASFIYALAKWNYWLALIVISLIPGLPLMAYPFIDSRMRAIILKSFRKLTSKFAG